MAAPRGAPRALVVVAAGLLASACFVTTSFDGLSGGPSDSEDAAPERATSDDGAIVVSSAEGSSPKITDATTTPETSKDAIVETSTPDAYVDVVVVSPLDAADDVIDAASGDPALVGYSAVAKSDDYLASGRSEAFGYKALVSGVAHHIAVFVRPGSTVPGMSAGIYSDNGGSASALLASAVFTTLLPGEWNIGDIAPTTIVKGQTYWLALFAPGDAGKLLFRSTTGGTVSYDDQNSALTALPTNWLNGTSYASSPASIYVLP